MADSIVVDVKPLERHARAVVDGAVASFVSGAEKVLGAVQTGAVARWPVLTGASRAAFALRREIDSKRVSVAELNAEKYAYLIRWSKYTAESLERRAQLEARPIEDYMARGRTPEAQAQIEKWALGKLARLKMEPGETPLDAMRRKLHKRHGRGAPSADVAGKNPWSVLVRRPAKAAESAFVESMRAQLAILAQRAR